MLHVRSKKVATRERRRLIPGLEWLEARTVPAGWTALSHAAPASLGTMELLTDGTVMVQGGGVSKTWYRLTPDSTGSYVNGTWSSLATMSLERLYTATNVLKDGRVFELGGEYSGPGGSSTWINTGEIYNPVTNGWSSIPNFPQTQFGDDPSMLLDNGRILCGYLSGPQTYLYDPATNSWSQTGTKIHNSDRSDEETWLKLPDGSVLSYDVFNDVDHNAPTAQRYVPSSGTWVDAGAVPVHLSSSALGYEMGGATMLPDGRAWYVGATGHTAFYTPSTNTWAIGPDIPNGQHADDAPLCMMPNGHVLLAVDGPGATFSTPTRVYEFDPSTNGYTEVTPSTPNLSGTPAYVTRMLMLPSGEVLFNPSSSQLYVYGPTGSPLTAWKPTVTSVAPNGSNYTLTGTQLNGLSAGASYGDDAEMDTNYPIIELKNGSTTYFARTFNWSTTAVATGSTPVTTDFSLPAGLPNGTYSLYVVANGIASDPFTFDVGGGGGSNADLAVGISGPGTDVEGSTAYDTYTVTVTNNGPDAANNVILTNTLDANLKFISATASQGTFSQSGGVVTFSVGTMTNGQVVTLTVTAQSMEDGVLTDAASVASDASDANSGNNSATASTTVSEPNINVPGPITVSGKKVTNVQVATFTHANGVEPASAFVASIDWGDGKTSSGTITQSGATYLVRGSHTYAKGNGSHLVTTTVTEAGNPPGAPRLTGGHGQSSDSTKTADGSPLLLSQDGRHFSVDQHANGTNAKAGLVVVDQFFSAYKHNQDVQNAKAITALASGRGASANHSGHALLDNIGDNLSFTGA